MPDSLRVTITGIDDDGRGLATVGRRKVRVSQAYPGEDVVFQIDKKTRGEFQGRVQRLVAPSEDRIPSPCEHEFICTGCPLLGLSLESEREFKANKVTRILEECAPGFDTGALEYEVPSEPFGYRYYAKQVFGVARGRPVLGAFVAGTHHLVDNGGCPVLEPGIGRVLDRLIEGVREHRIRVHTEQEAGLRFALTRGSRAFSEELLVLSTSCRDHGKRGGSLWEMVETLVREVDSLKGVVVLLNEASGNSLLLGETLFEVGTVAIRESLGGFEHRVGPRSFFQINPVSADVLFGTAFEFAGEGESCLELFSGVGALTFELARRFTKVHAVEVNPEAVAALNERGAELKLGVQATVGDATEVAATILSQFDPTVCVADPPRKGLGEALCDTLVQSSIQRIVLLSCDPDSLQKDLPRLRVGGFEVKAVRAIDQFPRTAHVETVTLLER